MNLTQDKAKNTVTLVIDCNDKNWQVSKTGKTKVISSGGFMAIGDYRLSANLIKPLDK